MAKQPTNRVHQLEDALEAAKKRIDELREERDTANELVQRVRERLERNAELFAQWQEAFEMREDPETGKLSWMRIVERYDERNSEYYDLLKQWNKYVDLFVGPKEIGRPLAASEAQCAQVLKLRKEGTPLRLIVDETSLSMRTVRTIIARRHGTDRTSVKRLQRIMPDKFAASTERALKRSRDAVLVSIPQALEESAELVLEAKGLGGGKARR
jgi:orotate phosphoribosyltransferase-like protein